MAPPWSRPLFRRRGAARRLEGIVVYHDFRWTTVFPDERAQFKNGLSLARLVSADCPAGKTPALLLTIDNHADEAPIETDDEFVVVLRIHDYLAGASGDAAAAYYAHKLRRGITSLGSFHELAQSPDLLSAFLNQHLTAELVANWISHDHDRMVQLAEITSIEGHLPRPSDDDIADAIRAIGEVPTAVWQALIDILPHLLDIEMRQTLLNAITSDERGRLAASQAIAARLLERIDDARRAANEYGELLNDGSSETDLQGFIEGHPWIVGFDYVAVRPRFGVPRGELDFVLERYDGFHDLLELKSPRDPIITAPRSATAIAPPAASKYSLSPGLANALAQVHVYRDVLTRDEDQLRRLYGLARSRNPRLIIVIGCVSGLSEDRKAVLEQLNMSLHRVEVVPYDVVGRRAEEWLSNVERYLATRAAE